MVATKNVSKLNPEVTLTIYVRDLNDVDFYAVLEKIDRTPGVLKGKKAWSFADFKADCDKHHKKAEEQYKKLLAEHVQTEPILQPDDETGEMTAAKDPNGQEVRRLKVIRDDHGRVKDYVYKDQVSFAKDVECLMEQHFETKLVLLDTDELAEIGLSPKELRSIRKLISDAPT